MSDPTQRSLPFSIGNSLYFCPPGVPCPLFTYSTNFGSTIFSHYRIKSPTRAREINQKIVAIVERAEIETAMLDEVVVGVVDRLCSVPDVAETPLAVMTTMTSVVVVLMESVDVGVVVNVLNVVGLGDVPGSVEGDVDVEVDVEIGGVEVVEVDEPELLEVVDVALVDILEAEEVVVIEDRLDEPELPDDFELAEPALNDRKLNKLASLGSPGPNDTVTKPVVTFPDVSN